MELADDDDNRHATSASAGAIHTESTPMVSVKATIEAKLQVGDAFTQ